MGVEFKTNPCLQSTFSPAQSDTRRLTKADRYGMMAAILDESTCVDILTEKESAVILDATLRDATKVVLQKNERKAESSETLVRSMKALRGTLVKSVFLVKSLSLKPKIIDS